MINYEDRKRFNFFLQHPDPTKSFGCTDGKIYFSSRKDFLYKHPILYAFFTIKDKLLFTDFLYVFLWSESFS